MLSSAAVGWRDHLSAAMTVPYDSAARRDVYLGWIHLTPNDRWSLIDVLTPSEEGWLAAAGRGADPATEPRALDAVAQEVGFDLHLTNGYVCRVPWHISTALEAADHQARASIELRDNGQMIWWPIIGDLQHVASLVAIHAQSSSPSTPGSLGRNELADIVRDLFPELLGARVDVAQHMESVVMRALNDGTPEQQQSVLAYYGGSRAAEIARQRAHRLSNPAYRAWAERLSLAARDPDVTLIHNLWQR